MERDYRGVARAAFQRAVRREREAIEHHDRAARYLDRLAADLEHEARNDRDEHLRNDALATVRRARARADAARARAQHVRSRLTGEGVQPDFKHGNTQTANATRQTQVPPSANQQQLADR